MSTFVTPLRRAKQTAATDLAAACGSYRATYEDLWVRCRRLAGGFRALGLDAGDRIAILGANCHRYLETYLAAPASGMVIVPLNTRHAEPELRYALEDSGARLLVTDREPGSLGAVVDDVIRLPDDYERLIEKAEEADLGEGISEGTLAGLLYTGGTTGASKGVMLTHRNLMANALHMIISGRLTGEDRWLVMAPMFHAAGTVALLALVWLGGAQVFLPSFDAGPALDLIEAERVTSTLGVPTMIAALADEQLRNPRDVGRLRFLGHGGAPIATEIVRRAKAAFPGAELVHYYGATETAPIATALPHEEECVDLPQARSCGQSVVGIEIDVLDSAGRPLPVGAIGEVAVRGPNIMRGYWNKPDATSAALRDGWYLSGDLGYLDERGFLFLVDRKKDMIVSGGENVYSTEVEEAIYTHPMVLEAAVFGVPDPKWGESVYAVVVPRGPVTEEEIQAHCRKLIAGYKVPKTVEIREESLPKSGPGKILKRDLREPHWVGRETRIGGGEA